jgi:uncharacterized OB-fold protein
MFDESLMAAQSPVTPRPMPVPVPDDLTLPYWEGARRHELVIQRCTSCGTYIHPPRVACRVCQSLDLDRVALSPRGTIYSYTVCHVAFVPGFEDDLPTILVLVSLDVEPRVRIATALLNCKPENVRVGMPVELVYRDVTDATTLPYAIPASSRAERGN